MIGFNLTGWIWKQTRLAHRVVVGLTLASWLGLGIFYGWGYCFLTDWQWSIKRELGETDLPNSFVKYFADRLFNTHFDAGLIDRVTVLTFAAAILLAIFMYVKDRRVKQRPS